MTDGVKRERFAHGTPGAQNEAGAQANLLEQSLLPKISDAQEQRIPEALERQKKIGEFTERSKVLVKEIADFEEVVNNGVKVDPAGGAYDSANEEYANAMKGAFMGLLETGELNFINSQLENLK
jgi:hypothetical protein